MYPLNFLMQARSTFSSIHHVYPTHNSSSLHMTTQTRCSGRINDGMRSGLTTLRGSVLSSPTPAATLLKLPSQAQHVSCLTAFATVSNVSPFPLLPALMGYAPSAACECGAEEETADHVILQCPIHRPPRELHGLTVLDEETVEWLLNACPKI